MSSYFLGTFFIYSYVFNNKFKYSFKSILGHYLLLTIFLCSKLFGQDLATPVNSAFFREDQIYIGISLVSLKSNVEDFKPRALSRHFQWGIIRDIPLVSSSKFSTGLGLGMSFERYNTNLSYSEEIGYTFSEIDLDFERPLYFSIQSFEIPITLRWRNATFNDFAFWRIYGGVSLNWNFKYKAKQNSNLILFSDELKKWGATAHLSFGYNTWNFFIAYRLNPIFSSIPRNNNDFSIQFTPIKFGLIFYIL